MAWNRALLVLLCTSCAPSPKDAADPSQVENQAHEMRAHVNAGSPGSAFFLDPETLSLVMRSAEQGDIVSIKRLVNHYTWADDANLAIPWLRLASAKGDVAAMQDLAGRISVRGDKNNCEEANTLLEAALKTSSDEIQQASIKKDLDLLRSGNDGRGRCVRWFSGQE